MKKPLNTYVLPGLMRRAGTRKVEAVAFFIEAETLDGARFKVKHGVINAEVAKSFPGAWFRVNRRGLRLYQKHYSPGRNKKNVRH